MEEPYFLGKGWSFPPTFNSNTLTLNMVKANEDIEESLFILLSTSKKERVLRPRYGTNLLALVYENIDSSLYHRVVDDIKSAIVQFEPRIDVIQVRLEKSEEEAILFVHITYKVRVTNSRHNVVYPYYLDQGTLISEDTILPKGG